MRTVRVARETLVGYAFGAATDLPAKRRQRMATKHARSTLPPKSQRPKPIFAQVIWRAHGALVSVLMTLVAGARGR